MSCTLHTTCILLSVRFMSCCNPTIAARSGVEYAQHTVRRERLACIVKSVSMSDMRMSSSFFHSDDDPAYVIAVRRQAGRGMGGGGRGGGGGQIRACTKCAALDHMLVACLLVVRPRRRERLQSKATPLYSAAIGRTARHGPSGQARQRLRLPAPLFGAFLCLHRRCQLLCATHYIYERSIRADHSAEARSVRYSWPNRRSY